MHRSLGASSVRPPNNVNRDHDGSDAPSERHAIEKICSCVAVGKGRDRSSNAAYQRPVLIGVLIPPRSRFAKRADVGGTPSRLRRVGRPVVRIQRNGHIDTLTRNDVARRHD